MKRPLGPALLTLLLLVASVLLGACGDSSSSSDAADAASDATGSPSPTVTLTASPGALEPQTVAIVSQTAAGGEVDLNAVPVESDADRHAFTAQFERGALDEKIAAAVDAATIPEGFAVVGAVVAIGCDVPPGVHVTRGPSGWLVAPEKVAKPTQECFAPVTSVALVAVPGPAGGGS